MTRVENFNWFQVFIESLMFHAWKKSPLSTREEKCFQFEHRELQEMASKHWRHFALDRGVARNWSCQFLANKNQGKKHAEEWRCVFNSTPVAILSATMRLRNDFRLLPLDILVTQECMSENIFPHLTTRQSKGDFFHAWNIKLSTKTWNRLKFSTRVISKVYCSMMGILITFAGWYLPLFWVGNCTHFWRRLLV